MVSDVHASELVNVSTPCWMVCLRYSSTRIFVYLKVHNCENTYQFSFQILHPFPFIRLKVVGNIPLCSFA